MEKIKLNKNSKVLTGRKEDVELVRAFIDGFNLAVSLKKKN